MDIPSSLFNLAAILLGGFVITVLISILYCVRIVRYSKMESSLREELLKIEVNNIINKKKS